MSVVDAFISALGNFVSVWIFCLMQIIPFFIASIVGSGLRSDDNKTRAALVAALLSLAGFTGVFVSIGMSGAMVSKFIFSHIVLFTQIGGVFIGLSGLLFAGLLTFDETKKPVRHTVHYLIPILFGAAVGFAYKPCVSPALTDIYRIAGNPATVLAGGFLLFGYAVGIAVVIGGVAIGLTGVITHFLTDTVQDVLRMICGLVVITLAVVILTGNMTVYKSFLVGRFAPSFEAAP